MTDEIHFETPENICVSYRAAGPGTRFIAWFVDTILLWLLATVVAIPLLILFGSALEAIGRSLSDVDEPADAIHFGLYVLGIFWLLFSLSGFIYFGLSELLFRGQTIGKRQMRIRVVKADGFSLDPTCILIRTIFRVVDHLPPMWVVPLFTSRSQRIGDLTAGTIVVCDEGTDAISVRELASRKYADCRFHFDVTSLGRLRRQDIEAVERILERFATLDSREREALLDRLVPPLAARLQVDLPDAHDRLQFLEDLLSAEYRRQYRKLG